MEQLSFIKGTIKPHPATGGCPGGVPVVITLMHGSDQGNRGIRIFLNIRQILPPASRDEWGQGDK